MVKKKVDMCDIHHDDIEDLKKDLKEHKVEMYDLMDELKLDILEKMRPPLTKSQMITIILAVSTYMSLSIGFVNSNRLDIKVNSNEIKNVKEIQKKDSDKIDKIYDILLEMSKR